MKKYFFYAIYIIIGGSLLFGLLQLILAGYPVSWTGFGEYTLTNGEVVGEKKFWDWMELLIIPLFLAGGAFFLNRSERMTERQIADERRKEDRKQADNRAELERGLAKDRQQEAALQAYIDKMENLLLVNKLRTTQEVEVQDIARTRTLTVLRGLDGVRKGQVINFLYEAELIVDEKAVVNLTSADLRGADLRDADLHNANLCGADLRGANLDSADLRSADLGNADLRDADLRHANLRGANLQGASLWGACLRRTDLRGADLRDVISYVVRVESAILDGHKGYPIEQGEGDG